MSNFVYLEKVKSTSSRYIIAAFQRIFDRSEHLPEKMKYLLSDFGVEYMAIETQSFLKSNGIKLRPISKRLDRLSKGSSVCETTNRLVRSKLETYIADNGVAPLETMLKIVENVMNSEPKRMFGELSSKEVLLNDPKYISVLKSSNRYRKRKLLRKNVENIKDLPLYSIVRVKKNVSKEKLGFKESYGNLSDSMYIILEKKTHEFVNYYKLGNLYTLESVSNGSFSFFELASVNITYEKACYLDSIYTATVLKKYGDIVEFRAKTLFENLFLLQDCLLCNIIFLHILSQ